MTNSKLLKEAIEKSGYRVGHIAEKLGVSRASLYNKMDNKFEFKAGEIAILCELLGITSLKKKEEIFFAKMDDLKSTE